MDRTIEVFRFKTQTFDMGYFVQVAVLGASAKPDRYSHLALLRLQAHGHSVAPIHPTLKEVAGLTCLKNLGELPQTDAITVYISPEHQGDWISQLAHLKPSCLIFNPGTENPAAYAALEKAGWKVLEACTLVLLGTGQFESATRNDHV